MTKDEPMSTNRMKPRDAVLACIAGLCLAALASCSDSDSGGGGGGGGGGSPTTMQITPPAKPNSLSIAQVTELPSEQSYTATLTEDEDDQTLVYGFSLEAGNLFGADVTVESGRGQAMVRFYSQSGEEIATFDLPDGGVGFEAPRTGNYFMAISAAASGASGQSRSGATPRALDVPLALQIDWGAISSGTLDALQAAVVAGNAAALGGSATRVAQRLRDWERADMAVTSPTLDCPTARAGEECSLRVLVANVGGAAEGYVHGEFGDSPVLTYYLSTNDDITENDMPVGRVRVEQVVNLVAFIADRSVPVPHSIGIDLPETSGTWYYGACVSPLIFEMGTYEVTLSGRPRTTLRDLTGNNCSDAVEQVIEPAVSIAGGGSVTEGETLVYTVSLDAASDQQVTVDWRLSSGSATVADFSGATRGTLTFSPGVLSRTFTLTAIVDQQIETDEEAVVALSNPRNAILGPETTASGTIGDEVHPIVTIANAGSAEEGEPLVFIVSLSRQSGQTVTVDWALSSDGDATAADFSSATSGTLTFTPGDTIETITFATLEDQAGEGLETALVTLSNPMNAVLGLPMTASGIIRETEGEVPTVFFTEHSIKPVFWDDDTEESWAFRVDLDKVSDQVVTVEWRAAEDDGIYSNNGTLTFNPGEWRRIIKLPVRRINSQNLETIVRPTYRVTLSNPKNAVLGACNRAYITFLIVTHDVTGWETRCSHWLG